MGENPVPTVSSRLAAYALLTLSSGTFWAVAFFFGAAPGVAASVALSVDYDFFASARLNVANRIIGFIQYSSNLLVLLFILVANVHSFAQSLFDFLVVGNAIVVLLSTVVRGQSCNGSGTIRHVQRILELVVRVPESFAGRRALLWHVDQCSERGLPIAG